MSTDITARLAHDERIRVNVLAEPYLSRGEATVMARMAARGYARSLGWTGALTIRGLSAAAKIGERTEHFFVVSKRLAVQRLDE
jgi:hypothetical protein